jgi:hypothetical protein
MSSEYRFNHYVPEWYQKRFISDHQKERTLFRLDLKPENFTDSRGVTHQKQSLHRLGPKKFFAENDLYTTRFGDLESTAIEKLFFGLIDTNGRKAVEYFTDFAHPSINKDAFHALMIYMSTQKLRTPKGLDWLSNVVRDENRNNLLRKMVDLRQLFCAIWTECVWQIAVASESDTKFIISDHPITVYNRCCGPRSGWCRGFNDPDIGLNATHTLFPLSMEKVLILTNLTWVRNPYQSEIRWRPNPTMLRDAIFNFTEIQTMRHLTEQEVREINFIIKSRAYRYIAAGEEEWLYPENYVSKADWFKYGHGYLLMPDPRGVVYSTGIMIGGKNGVSTAFDAYGRRPGQEGFEFDAPVDDEFNTLQHFQGEFANLFGPYRRGRSFRHISLDNEKDDDEYHQYHLGLEKIPYGRKKRRIR